MENYCISLKRDRISILLKVVKHHLAFPGKLIQIRFIILQGRYQVTYFLLLLQYEKLKNDKEFVIFMEDYIIFKFVIPTKHCSCEVLCHKTHTENFDNS